RGPPTEGLAPYPGSRLASWSAPRAAALPIPQSATSAGVVQPSLVPRIAKGGGLTPGGKDAERKGGPSNKMSGILSRPPSSSPSFASFAVPPTSSEPDSGLRRGPFRMHSLREFLDHLAVERGDVVRLTAGHEAIVHN